MRKLLAIKVQSMTDLITNSSSELFQLRTDQTVEYVNEALKTITSGYCKPVLFNLKEFRINHGKLREILRAIYPDKNAPQEEWDKYWKKATQIELDNPDYVVMDVIKGFFFDPEDPTDVRNIQKSYLCNRNDFNLSPDPLQKEFEQFVKHNNYYKDKDMYNPFFVWNIQEEAFDKFITSHEMPDTYTCAKYSYYYGSVEQLDGCILVLSEAENSIPYDTWNAINHTFNGTNYHLG